LDGVLTWLETILHHCRNLQKSADVHIAFWGDDSEMGEKDKDVDTEAKKARLEELVHEIEASSILAKGKHVRIHGKSVLAR
jgi:hypothetical protein